MFLHSMILSHIEYCFINWSPTNRHNTQSKSLFKRALKIFDRKPLSYHHCLILQKYNLLSFETFLKFKYACAIYKFLHGLAPLPLSEYIKLKITDGGRTVTRASTCGDCMVPYRHTTFGQYCMYCQLRGQRS